MTAVVVADISPAAVTWQDGHVEHRRARAWLYDDAVYVALQEVDRSVTWLQWGVTQHMSFKDTWTITTNAGTLRISRRGCSGCSPLRSLQAPR